jgi:hypothetical protein
MTTTEAATSWTDALEVFCADIGSIPKGNFAWARRLARAPDKLHDETSISSLAEAVVAVLARGRPVALGLEMPLFVPVPGDEFQLGKRRPCDINAPAWSSGIGASVLATGIPQAAWLLRRIYEQLPATLLHLRWSSMAQAKTGLLVWETFVTGAAKGKTHQEDALLGLKAFCAQLPSPGDANANDTERPFSLAAAAAMWAGWNLPAAALREPCLVVRA